MTEIEIIDALREYGKRKSALKTIFFLKEILNGNLTQFTMMRYFMAAFNIPLGTLISASVHRSIIGEEGIGDKEFSELLSPWFPDNDADSGFRTK